MAQLSRPYQIGLAAVAVLAAAWLILIQGHSHGNSGAPPGSPAQVASTPAAPAAKAPASKSEGNAGQATGGGSASSLGSLGHAVEKARGAVTTSKQNAKQLSERSAQASSETTTTTSTTKPVETTGSPSTTKAAAPSAKTHTGSQPAKRAAPGVASRNTSNLRQHTVEEQLAHGKVAVILFWDKGGSDDRLVRRALLSLRGNRGLNIAIDEASASQVASFGSITRGVQVLSTPTLLFINKKGGAVTLTGLQDSYSIAQAVREARSA
jgi:hypothetical protein